MNTGIECGQYAGHTQCHEHRHNEGERQLLFLFFIHSSKDLSSFTEKTARH